MTPEPVMDADALNAFLGRAFAGGGGLARVTRIRTGFARLELETGAKQLRPGGIVSGSNVHACPTQGSAR